MIGTSTTCLPDTHTYTMHQRMLDAAISAYAITPHGFNPDCKYWAPIRVKGNATPMLGGPYWIDAGFMAETEDDWVVVSLRGTLSGYDSWDSFVAFIEDWLGDDKTKQVPMYAGGSHLGNVHKGFLEATQTIWFMLKPQLTRIDWSSKQGLQITGHSKGAGMTFLLAALVRAELGAPGAGGPQEVHVNAYAAPLAGDAKFAAKYKELKLDKTTTRHQRAHDVVPFVPPYLSWNIFDHLTWEYSRPESLAIYTALEALGDEIYGGYELVGNLILYPGVDPVGPNPLSGIAAVSASQAAIVAAVKYGDGDMIKNAHSAAHSYWPALFQQPNPVTALEVLEAEAAEHLGACS